MKLDKSTTFDDLKKSGKYDEYIINCLINKEIEVLNELPSSLKGDSDFMEPILYAVKNEMKTFKVYRYMGKNLQSNFAIASEVIVDEPELIKESPIRENKQFILNNVDVNSKIIEYMSPVLKMDGEFIAELVRESNADIKRAVVTNCNVAELLKNNIELCSDKQFMYFAIMQDSSLFKFATSEIKNDKEFVEVALSNDFYTIFDAGEKLKDDREWIHKVSADDSERVKILANRCEEFGDNGLLGILDTINEHFQQRLKTKSELAESGDEDRRENQDRTEVQEQIEGQRQAEVQEQVEVQKQADGQEQVEGQEQAEGQAIKTAKLVLGSPDVTLQDIELAEARNRIGKVLNVRSKGKGGLIIELLPDDLLAKARARVEEKARGISGDGVIKGTEEIEEATVGVRISEITKVKNEIQNEIDNDMETRNPEIE